MKLIQKLTIMSMSVVPVASVLSISGTISNIGYSSDNYSYKNLKGGSDKLYSCESNKDSSGYTDNDCEDLVYGELKGLYSGNNKRFVKAKIEVEHYNKGATRNMKEQNWLNEGYKKYAREKLVEPYKTYYDLRMHDRIIGETSKLIDKITGTCTNVAAANIASWESNDHPGNSSYQYGRSVRSHLRLYEKPQTLFNEIYYEALSKNYTTYTKGTADWYFMRNTIKIQKIAYDKIWDTSKKLNLITSDNKIREVLDKSTYPRLMSIPGHSVVSLGYVDVKVDWVESKKVKSGFLWWSKTKVVDTPKVTWERYYVVATGWHTKGNYNGRSTIGYYKKSWDINSLVDIS